MSNGQVTEGDPLVSVIMNCFNGEKYLREAIDSVVAQTYRNWELIFWDNQSTDHSAAIVKSYTDPKIKYFYAPKHTMLYEGRNFAIEKASGDFIAFLDVDDWWISTKLECQIPLFSDLAVGLVGGNFWIENEQKASRWKAHERPAPTGWVLDELLKSYYIGLLTLVIRRAALIQLDYVCDPRFHIIGDFDLAVRLTLEWKLAYVQEPVAHYRLHGSNETGRHRARQINEWEIWLSEFGTTEPFRSSPGLPVLRVYLAYWKALNEILAGSRWTAFRLSRALPWGRLKSRLLFALLSPGFVVRRLKN